MLLAPCHSRRWLSRPRFRQVAVVEVHFLSLASRCRATSQKRQCRAFLLFLRKTANVNARFGLQQVFHEAQARQFLATSAKIQDVSANLNCVASSTLY